MPIAMTSQLESPLFDCICGFGYFSIYSALYNIYMRFLLNKFITLLALGAVRLSYEVKAGSLTPMGDLVEAALPGDDFVAMISDVIIYDG